MERNYKGKKLPGIVMPNGKLIKMLQKVVAL